MFPICFANEAANARSVSVLVSNGELAKPSSIARVTATPSSALAMRTVYQPTIPLIHCGPRSSRYL